MYKNRVVTAIICITAVAGLSGCDMIMGLVRAKRASVKWEGPVKEITFARLDKEGAVFDIEMHSRIDAPVERVWEAMAHPERLADYSDMYKLSRLVKEEGNTKQLEIHMLALDNLQTLTVELAFDKENRRISIKTISSSIADIDGSYELVPSPDGTKTLYVYKAIQTDKVQIPISTDVQRSAIKESFVNQINAMKKQMGLG